MVCTDRQGLFVTESLKRYSGAPTCESGLTLFRSAAQADLFYFLKIFSKKCGKRLAKAAHICYNSKAILVMASWSSG